MDKENLMDILLPRHTLEEALGTELAKQYRLSRGEDCVYMPVSNGTDYLCTCGAVNPMGEACAACGRKPELLERQVLEDLRREAQERLEQENAQRAREEAVRQAQEALLRKKKRRRILATAAAAVGVLAVVVAAAWAVVRFAVPAYHYDRALDALQKEDYQQAHREFTLAGDHRDAREYLERFYTPVLSQRSTVDFSTSLTQYSYDALGRLVKTTEQQLMMEAQGVAAPGELKVYERNYDEQGRLLEAQDWFGRTLYEYNEQGDVRMEEHYLADGQLDSTRYNTYLYDEQGRVLEAVEISMEHIAVNYSYEQTDRYTYDEAGRVTWQSREMNFPASEEAGYRSVTTWRYDSQGRPVEKTVTVEGTFDDSNDSREQETWTYDDAGRVVRREAATVHYRSSGMDAKQTYTCTYSSRGDVTEEVTVYSFPNDAQRDHISRRECTYDRDGRLVKEVEESEFADPERDAFSGYCATNTYSYDLLGRLVEEVRAWEQSEETQSSVETEVFTYGADGMLETSRTLVEMYEATSESTVTYNENGLPQRVKYGTSGAESEYEYTYAYFYYPEGTEMPDNSVFLVLYG